MKKGISLALCALLVCSTFSACDDQHTHTYATDSWKSDATKHWHAATCEHTSEMSDVDGHSDSDKDGKCDVCGYVVCEHTYATEWSADADGHYYASTCGDDVKKDEAAHTPDLANVCTVCGYKLGTPDVSTFDKALAVGTYQGKLVESGSIKNMYSNTYGGEMVKYVNYEFRDGYTYVKEETPQENEYAGWIVNTTEYYYSLSDDGVPFGVSSSTLGADPYGTNAILDVTADSVNGYSFDGDFSGYTVKAIGVEEMVNALYEDAALDLNGDFSGGQVETDEEEGTSYSFSYGIQGTFYFCQLTVAFTLDDNGMMDKVGFYSEQYSLNDITTDGETGYVTVNADAEVVTTYEYEISQYTDGAKNSVENPYAANELLATSLKLVDGENEEVGNTLTLTKGSSVSLSYADVLPATAELAFNTRKAMVGDEVLWMSGDLGAIVGTSSVIFYPNEVGTYDVVLTIGRVTKQISVTVEYAPVTEVTTQVQGASGYYQAATETTVYANSTLMLKGATNTYADQSVTAEIISKPNGATIDGETPNTVLEIGSGDGVYTFTASVEGEYVVEFTSTVDDTKSATVTVTVIAPPTAAELLNGAYSAYFGYWRVNFEPSAAGATNGNVTIVDTSNSWGYGVFSQTTTYTYNENDGTITLGATVGYTYDTGGNGTKSYTFTLSVVNYQVTITCEGDTNLSKVMDPISESDLVSGLYKTWTTNDANLVILEENKSAYSFELALNSDGTGVLKIWNYACERDYWGNYSWYEDSKEYQASFTYTLSGSTITFAGVKITYGTCPSDYTNLLTTATVGSIYKQVELVLVSGDTPVTVTLN